MKWTAAAAALALTSSTMASALANTPAGPRLALIRPAAGDVAAAEKIKLPSDWPQARPDAILIGLAAAPPERRQGARWTYALNLLARGRSADALGVLDVMIADEPDMALVENVQLARGRALVEIGHAEAAIGALALTGLAANPEAAAWRLRAYALLDAPVPALRQMPLARPAMVVRTAARRGPFLIAASRMALEQGNARAALHWLTFVPQSDPSAMVTRGQALMQVGQAAAALRAFQLARKMGQPTDRAAAELGEIKAQLASNKLPTGDAMRSLQALTFRWRGDATEREALSLIFDLARAKHDNRVALQAGAVLVRYHRLGVGLKTVLQQVQGLLQAMLAAGSRTPLKNAAGLYWDYRDLAPGGPGGDVLALQLVDRLQEAGLYARAAEILEHQLLARAKDLARGPLSIRVARSWVLAGKPDRAIEALRASSSVVYPDSMMLERQRVEAIALHLLGRTNEALALLADWPQAAALRSELQWKQRDWAAIVAEPLRIQGQHLSEVQQVVILRRAVALAMIGDRAALHALQRSYAKQFARTPAAGAFDLMTGASDLTQPQALSSALAAMPPVSPAGPDADLLELSGGS